MGTLVSPARTTSIPVGRTAVDGDLALPPGTGSLILVAHGSGSSRRSQRNAYVAGVLAARGFGTLLFDLLTPEEQAIDRVTAELRFDIGLLAQRVMEATDWLGQQADTRALRVGYVGASTGAAAALMAAAARPEAVGAVVSRGGRPDLTGSALPEVAAPTLFIVGALDEAVLDLTRSAMSRMRVDVALSVIPGAGHVFDEPSHLDEAARLTADWLSLWLPAGQKSAERDRSK